MCCVQINFLLLIFNDFIGAKPLSQQARMTHDQRDIFVAPFASCDVFYESISFRFVGFVKDLRWSWSDNFVSSLCEKIVESSQSSTWVKT